MKKRVPKKVHLSILRNNSYAEPNAPEFRDKYPQSANYCSAIFLNDYRVYGGKDHNRSYIFDTYKSGQTGIETIQILKALKVPDEIISQIEFEEE